jgi:hypothetical protein
MVVQPVDESSPEHAGGRVREGQFIVRSSCVLKTGARLVPQWHGQAHSARVRDTR